MVEYNLYIIKIVGLRLHPKFFTIYLLQVSDSCINILFFYTFFRFVLFFLFLFNLII